MDKSAREIMTADPITVGINNSVLEAYQKMGKNRIRHLLVTDESGTLVGILSDRDVQRCIRFDRKATSRYLDVELNLDPEIKVVDAMSSPVHRVNGDVPVRDVALRMLNEKLSSMIVEIPKSNRRGIITTDDLLRVLVSLLEKDPGSLRMCVSTMIDNTLFS